VVRTKKNKSFVRNLKPLIKLGIVGATDVAPSIRLKVFEWFAMISAVCDLGPEMRNSPPVLL